MNDEPVISVVITAYNRKEFLMDAIKSVINQTLDKKYYEIIVVKNFNDDKIDEYIDKNNIKSILMDATMGEFLYKGINESKGNIISFLDDDDLFLNNKLEYVYNLFKNNKDTVYYHNRPIFVDIDNNILKIKNINPDFNMSSISIRNDIINLNLLREITLLPDCFMYYSALESNKKVITDNTGFTYYRYHDSISRNLSSNIEERKIFNVNSIKNIIKNFKLLSSFFESSSVNSNIIMWINTQIFGLWLNDGINISINEYFKIIFINAKNKRFRDVVANIIILPGIMSPNYKGFFIKHFKWI